MFHTIMKAFVPGYGEKDEPQVREKSGKVAGAIGIATNFLLFAIKLVAGLLSGSVAVMADAVNNLTDSGSSIVMLVGFKLAGKPADAKHPFRPCPDRVPLRCDRVLYCPVFRAGAGHDLL